jgi:uncharacterized protein with NRDE domain
MCLIVLAHLMSERYPLVIAANRDEEYARPSIPAAFWEGEDVAGGRDALHGGSWLAVNRKGRFAAVTNLRGSIRTNQPRSRGELVAGFVLTDTSPRAYLGDIEGRIGEYGGFHLLTGEAGVEIAQLSGSVRTLGRGIHGLSNAPAGVTWPKVDVARDALRGALETPERSMMIEKLLRLLRTAPANGDPMRDLFIAGEQYGTRASTVIVVEERTIHFVEQNFSRGGVVLGERNELRFART